MPVSPERAPLKKAARPWKSPRVQGWNGWSWQRAQSSRAPRKARDAGGEPLGVGLLRLGVEGHGDEVRRRVVGPEPLVGDQVADDLVIRAVAQQLVAEPGDEPPAPVDQERSVLGPDIGAGQPFGPGVGEAAVA
jgi:hypothetical protein